MRSKLFALVFIAIVPAALLVLWMLIAQYRERTADARNQAIARARAVAAAVDSQILQVHSALNGLATAGSLPDADYATFREQALSLLRISGLSSIVLVDAEGRQLANTLRPYGAELPSLSKDAPTRKAVLERRPLAEMTTGAVSGRPVIVASVPVRQGGEVRYGLSAVIDGERFTALLAGQTLPAGWIAALVEPNGLIAWRNIRPDDFVGKPATATLRGHIARAPEGAFEAKSLDGVDTLTVYTRAPQAGWTIVFGIPTANLIADLTRSLLLLGFGTALVFALSGLAAWAYGGQIVRSTAALVDLSRELAIREHVPLPPLQFSEAHQLGESMIHANRRLREAHSDVAQQEARLRALLDAAMDGVVVIDRDRHVVQCNAAACRMFGREPDDMPGRALAELLPEAAQALQDEPAAQALQDEPAAQALQDEPAAAPRDEDIAAASDAAAAGRRFRALHREGWVFPVEASIARFESDGQPFVVAIVRDVTRRQQMEDELLRSNLELRQFAHAASHDLPSPLR